jgi:hypothetical protein
MPSQQGQPPQPVPLPQGRRMNPMLLNLVPAQPHPIRDRTPYDYFKHCTNRG